MAVSASLAKNYAIIVAGGSGSRMGASVPKQFLLLSGQPVIMHTIQAFSRSEAKPHILIVLPAKFHGYWDELCIKHAFKIDYELVSGGETRFHSVKNGLDTIPGTENTIVAVHDAVRPLISPQLIDEAYHRACINGNAVLAVKSRDSVRRVMGTSSESMVRDEIYLVQTPQTFQLHQLKKAYGQAYQEKFTDDASVVESAGFPIHLLDGSYSNIKITFPGDIAIAELLLNL
jgi:2-C-methyl-D-erythritol 4-phosphate cytidylyltransferase